MHSQGGRGLSNAFNSSLLSKLFQDYRIIRQKLGQEAALLNNSKVPYNTLCLFKSPFTGNVDQTISKSLSIAPTLHNLAAFHTRISSSRSNQEYAYLFGVKENQFQHRRIHTCPNQAQTVDEIARNEYTHQSSQAPLIKGVALVSTAVLSEEYKVAQTRAARCQFLPKESHAKTLLRPLIPGNRRTVDLVASRRAKAISQFLGLPITTLTSLELNTLSLLKPDSAAYLRSDNSTEQSLDVNELTLKKTNSQCVPTVVTQKYAFSLLSQALGEHGYKAVIFVDDSDHASEKGSDHESYKPESLFADGSTLSKILTDIHKKRSKEVGGLDICEPLENLSVCLILPCIEKKNRNGTTKKKSLTLTDSDESELNNNTSDDNVIYELGPTVQIDFIDGLLREKRATGNFTTRSPLIQSVLGQKNAVSLSSRPKQDKDKNTKKSEMDLASQYDYYLSPVSKSPDEITNIDIFKPGAMISGAMQISRAEKSLANQSPLPEIIPSHLSESNHRVPSKSPTVSTPSKKALLKILDCTAGFGTDSLIIAAASRIENESDIANNNNEPMQSTELVLLERNPVLFILLVDAIAKAQTNETYFEQNEKKKSQNDTSSSELPKSVEDKLRSRSPIFSAPSNSGRILSPDEKEILERADAILQSWLRPGSSVQGSIQKSMEAHYREIASIAKRVTILFGDSTQYVGSLAQSLTSESERPYDVVYIDPFYPVKHSGKQRLMKDARRNTKYMLLAKVLSQLESDTENTLYSKDSHFKEPENTHRLIAAGRLVSKRRVVLKRPLHAERSHPKLVTQFIDRNTRFDVIAPALGKGDWKQTFNEYSSFTKI